MGFFSNLFGQKLHDPEPLTPARGISYILEYFKFTYYRGKMYLSGHYEVGGGDCLFNDNNYGKGIKHVRELLEKILYSAPNNLASNKWETDDIECEFYNINPYLDSNGVEHFKGVIIHIKVRPSVFEYMMLHEPPDRHHVIRLEYVSKKEWNGTVSRFYYFSSERTYDILNRKNEVKSNFLIQNSNVGKEWKFCSATPRIWEKAGKLGYLDYNI